MVALTTSHEAVSRSPVASTPILLLQQVPHEPAALIGDVITEAGRSLHRVRVDAEAVPADAKGFSAVVIMGGPASANDDSAEIRDQLRLVTWCLNHDTPIFGVCLGAQLIARAAGGSIVPAAERELGWYPLHPAPAAKRDPLFRHLEATTPVFQWHGETFTLPGEATLLASSDAVPHQAFRLGRAHYGLQFHVEIDAPLIDRWIDCCDDERNHLGTDGVARIRGETPRYLARANALCRQMVVAWLALL